MARRTRKYGAPGSAMNQYKANPLINIKRRIHYALRNGNLPKEATLLEYGSNKDVDNNKARLIL
jgi:hypothetical protein